MDTNTEVVHIMNEKSLIDSESYERRYATSRPLRPGFYVVQWPPGAREFAYNDEPRWIGPFQWRALATGMLEDSPP